MDGGNAENAGAFFGLRPRNSHVPVQQKNPGHCCPGRCSSDDAMDQGTNSNAFQAASRLYAFTEPRPAAKLQPGLDGKAMFAAE
jgi:hypothetical protein